MPTKRLRCLSLGILTIDCLSLLRSRLSSRAPTLIIALAQHLLAFPVDNEHVLEGGQGVRPLGPVHLAVKVVHDCLVIGHDVQEVRGDDRGRLLDEEGDTPY